MPYAPRIHGAERTVANRKEYDKTRSGFTADRRWRKLRAIVLAKEPLCRQCSASGSIMPATQVDHIIPRDERPDLTFDENNLQPLCDLHHGQKTRTEHANPK